jgi:hypothetical protein
MIHTVHLQANCTSTDDSVYESIIIIDIGPTISISGTAEVFQCTTMCWEVSGTSVRGVLFLKTLEQNTLIDSEKLLSRLYISRKRGEVKMKGDLSCAAIRNRIQAMNREGYRSRKLLWSTDSSSYDIRDVVCNDVWRSGRTRHAFAGCHCGRKLEQFEGPEILRACLDTKKSKYCEKSSKGKRCHVG